MKTYPLPGVQFGKTPLRKIDWRGAKDAPVTIAELIRILGFDPRKNVKVQHGH